MRVHNSWEFLQRIASGFFFGDLLKVSGDRSILRDAGEVDFDFLDLGIGKEAAGNSVAVLLE